MNPQVKPSILPSAAPLTLYEQRMASGSLNPDSGQQVAMEALSALYDAIIMPKEAPRGLRKLLAPKAALAHGLYLWGEVGRGKSMLMDMFVESFKNTPLTRRVHFHAFMLDIHKRLHALRQMDSTGDLMPRLIEGLASETRVLCLDEFQVTDVTDAMILSRLFSGLMEAGVAVVFTSNRPPRDLYQGGLQREQFMKFVVLVEKHLRIVELKSPHDYRLAQLKAMQRTFMYPRDGKADDFLMEIWEKLTGGAPSQKLKLEVQGRTLVVEKQAHGVAWLTFGELCVRPLGAADYLTLAKVFHTILLQGIPALTPESRNEAKRFVTLIDALYDHRVKLIATAETAPDDIYPKGDGTFEFARTVSRLVEMQSEQYLALAHIS